jgi:predicted amidophosphoribosyltransferase
MFCCKCDNDLAKCTCPDLLERLESILKIPQLYVEPEYEERIRKQAEANKAQKN